MSLQKIILLVVLMAIIMVALGAGIYYFFHNSRNLVAAPINNKNNSDQTQQKVELEARVLTPAEDMKRLQTAFPEIITGVIKFLDAKGYYKTTIKTDDGTTYILWPAQPESVYKSFGAKDGGRVQVNGKPLDGGKLNWALMKPI